MEIAKLVLEYVKALVWPLTVIALSLAFAGKSRGCSLGATVRKGSVNSTPGWAHVGTQHSAD